VYQISVLIVVGIVSVSLPGVLNISQPEVADENGETYVAGAEPKKTVVRGRGRPKPDGLRYRTRLYPALEKETPRLAGPPLARVYQYLLHLRRQHTDLVDAGEVKKAKKLQRRISEFERRFRYPVPTPQNVDPRVHAVGFYSAGQKPVRVRVTDNATPVVLVLTAYESVTWIIDACDDAQIDFVICTGYHKQIVDGLPQGVPVFSYSYDDRSHEYAYAYGSDRAKWENLEDSVRTWTGGLDVSTVAGSYSATKELYVVGPDDPDWRVQMLDCDIQ
jgi:hypothetical protein